MLPKVGKLILKGGAFIRIHTFVMTVGVTYLSYRTRLVMNIPLGKHSGINYFPLLVSYHNLSAGLFHNSVDWFCNFLVLNQCYGHEECLGNLLHFPITPVRRVQCNFIISLTHVSLCCHLCFTYKWHLFLLLSPRKFLHCFVKFCFSVLASS